MSGGFFWFDPFGAAPADADVSGHAGGPITWGGVPSWPFERRESPSGLRPLLSEFAFRRPRPRHEPHFQMRTDVDPNAPPADTYARIEWTRHVVYYPIAWGSPEAATTPSP